MEYLRTSSRTRLLAGLAPIGLLGGAALFAAGTAIAQPAPIPATAPFERIQIRDNIYVIAGPDGNVVVQTGVDGGIVVDGQRAELGKPLVAELKKLTTDAAPVRYYFNTNGDPGHAGANEEVRNSGRQVLGGNMAGQAGDLAETAVHMAHENVLVRLSSGEGASEGAYPKETYASDWYDFYFNGEGVQLIHAPAAHTDGDSMIYFRKSDVIAAGEVWNTITYPVIDTAHGGSIQGEIDALNKIIDLTIPRDKQEGGTLVVPGRGRVGDEAEIVEYRDMVTIIRDRIKAMADKGMTLEQVKAAKPTFDYDGRYGAATGPWTTDMFVSAVYAGVKPQRPQRTRASR
jgi:glyoxylase-like metal-dependent hydrolase (beta-lactamase superfamily II)